MEKQIDSNDSVETSIEFEISNYDSVIIEILEFQTEELVSRKWNLDNV